jgi:Lrp/AsnC family transcriptional regulator for asnA, asnC and gidA
MKKIGYDWGSFTGISLNKDEDSSRIMYKKNTRGNGMLLYHSSYTLYIKIIARNHEHMRKYFMKIDVIPGIAKTDSMIELGCAFKRNLTL